MFKKILLSTLAILVFSSVAITVFLYRTYQQITVDHQETELPAATGFITPTPDPLAPYNILFLGYGGGKHEGGLLTDTMILLNIRPREKEVTLISIPRDLWIPLPINGNRTENFKINAAYAIGNDDLKYPNKLTRYSGETGGSNLTKYAVELVTGMPIKYYVSINFDGFEKTINTLGGVYVIVPQTFDDNYYPVRNKEKETCGKSEEEIKTITATLSGQLLEQAFTCRYEHLHFDAGKQHMDGENALKFVRSRHSPTAGGDFNRTLRQQALLVAVKNRILALRSLPKLPALIRILANNVKTDFDITKLAEIIKTHGNPSDYEIKTVSLNDENVLNFATSLDGQYILIPKDGENNWEGIHQYIERQIEP